MNKFINNKYNYIWDYLIPENNDREQKLSQTIEPYLNVNETILDMVCGFSPLTSLFTEKYKCRVIGFDINKKTINYCQEKYDKKLASFIVDTDENFNTDENIQVHMHLGISPSTNELEPKDDVGTSFKFILLKRPRLIILEAAIQYSLGMDKLVRNINNLGNYQLIKTTKYKINFRGESINPALKTTLKRKIAIFVKKDEINYCSLNDSNLINLIYQTFPSSQAESIADINIGFGFIYYSLARILRPQNTLIFGSAKGFSPICFALGIKDNRNNGTLHFVDAAYSDVKDGLAKGMGGEGFWKHQNEVKKQFQLFGVDKIIKLFVMTTAKYHNLFKKNHFPLIDLLYIDANHSYKNFKYDFEHFSKFLSPTGIIIFHDALVEKTFGGFNFGVKEYFEKNLIGSSEYSVFRIPVWPGVGLVQKTNNNFIVLSDIRLEKLRLELKEIESDKLFKLWQKYCSIRDNFRKPIQSEINNTNTSILQTDNLDKNLENTEIILNNIKSAKFFKLWQIYRAFKN